MATATITTCTSSSPKVATQQLSVPEVRERLTATAIATVQAMVKDNEERMAGYEKKIALLNEGVFYGNEYFTALKAQNQTPCLDYFVKKGSFYHGLAPSSHFVMESDEKQPTHVKPSRFLLKEGAKPSEALAAIRKGLSFIGCGETCQIGYYEAIREVLGTEKFDMLFAADSPTPLVIHFTNDNSLDSLIIKISPSQKIVKGHIAGISNVKFYMVKHAMGEAAAYNALCNDDTPGHETFITLGLDSKGVSHEEVKDRLLEEFNKDPFGMQAVTKETACRILNGIHPVSQELAKKYEHLKISKEAFIKAQGGTIPGTLELDAERITKLANSSFKEARALFTQWNKKT